MELVYILTNPTMPDLVKIGKTSVDIRTRLQQLSSRTEVPVPFECFYCCEVKNNQDVEDRLHDGFKDHRINPKREFFRINPERIKSILGGWAIKDMTPNNDVVESQEEQDSLDKERSRRPVFTFSMVNIPIGSILTFSKDETLTATVTGDREIEFEGEKSSLSAVTRDIIENKLGETRVAFRGPDFWMFENKTLTERRLSMED